MEYVFGALTPDFNAGYAATHRVTHLETQLPEDGYEPSKAELLADLITGSASCSSIGATVQHSHRFPIHQFLQIENMARMGGVPVSLIINQLLEAGLEAIAEVLPEEVCRELSRVQEGQLQIPTVTQSVEVKTQRVSKVRVVRPKKQ